MKIKEKLSREDFIYMYNLEKRYYSEEFITPVEESYLWYINRKDSILVMEEKGEIKGFINIFPIKDEIFKEILNGSFNDANMVYEDIYNLTELISGKVYNLFFSCVVMDKEWKDRHEGLKLLINNYICCKKDFTVLIQ